MIILSRNRTETFFDTELAKAVASRYQKQVLSIPFLYDLRSFGQTVSRLRNLDEPSFFLMPFPVRVIDNLLKFLGIKNIVAVMDISAQKKDHVFEFFEKNGLLPVSSFDSDIFAAKIEHLDEPTIKRWYPVIDQKECLGCLECVNFCLFGVYVIGKEDKPLVDQPDACRNGCPACARVCPGAAIMFPLYDDPDIAGLNDAESVRQKFDPVQAEKERQQHRPADPRDELKFLVDEVDKIKFS